MNFLVCLSHSVQLGQEVRSKVPKSDIAPEMSRPKCSQFNKCDLHLSANITRLSLYVLSNNYFSLRVENKYAVTERPNHGETK